MELVYLNKPDEQPAIHNRPLLRMPAIPVYEVTNSRHGPVLRKNKICSIAFLGSKAEEGDRS